MVAKISTGGNMFGALAYNQNKVDSEEARCFFQQNAVERGREFLYRRVYAQL